MNVNILSDMVGLFPENKTAAQSRKFSIGYWLFTSWLHQLNEWPDCHWPATFNKAGLGGGEAPRLWEKMERTASLFSRADFVGDSPSDRIDDGLRT
ncbi:hypothetical protein HPB48_005452 [Haemaphysalis longicornis]|uniref:Uncharacterized protein n=1 Tax=Haemaphysalis longicornis TaxID=44386 RepID=A0A9J6G9X9_HAELO|nr:hypothetical protein HPB48_005452 [Haemaphysalis longicornis]